MDLTKTIAITSRFFDNQWSGDIYLNINGHAWLDGRHLDTEAMLNLPELRNPDTEIARELLFKLDGDFTIIYLFGSPYWIYRSPTSTHPIFYRKEKNSYYLSDDPTEIPGLPNADTDDFTALYFKTFGVCPDGTTLHPNLHMVEAGEFIQFGFNGIDRYNYQTKLYAQTKANSTATQAELAQQIRSSFRGYADYLADKKVLLPLTAGYDSRLLASLLKEHGHKQVICATWGRKDNKEEAIARQVAEQLDYPWHFVDYSKLNFDEFEQNPEFRQYCKFAGHWSAMPYLQDFFAIRQLKHEGVIDESTIVLPGHMGDFPGGSHLKEEHLEAQPSKIIDDIIDKYGSALPINEQEHAKLSAHLQDFFEKSALPSWRAAEAWNLSERQHKLILNSSIAYWYWDMQVIHPLYDTALLKFLLNLKPEQRIGSALYHQCLEDEFFRPLQLNFGLKPKTQAKYRQSRLKSELVRHTPTWLKEHYYQMNDDICYKEFTRAIRSANPQIDFQDPMRPNRYNAYLIQWYLALHKSLR